jgi:hypothetical protein
MKLEQLQRRTFITLLGAAGAAGALSRAGYGQQTGRPLVGLLSSGRTDQAIIAAFKQGFPKRGSPTASVSISSIAGPTISTTGCRRLPTSS